MNTIETPVLICGGGSVGLSLSNFLSAQGIESLLIERHPRTSHLPKAHYLNQRSMEILREYGMADTIYERGTPMEHMGCVVWLTSLGGDGPLDQKLIHKMDAFGGGRTAPDYERDSPTRSGNLPQLRLEPVLQDFAQQRGPGTLRFNHELTEFVQDGDGVTATVLDREKDETYQVRARYLIGADGGRMIGPKLGIKTEGPTNLIKMISTHFSADLSSHIDDDDPLIRWLINPEGGGGWGSGAMVAMGPEHFDRRSEEWNIHFAFGTDDESIDEAQFAPRIRQLLKLPDLDITILKVSPWIVEAVLAERYREGRIFLAGDAAHRHPPTTGLGLNTGLQDAHNLAWKLAMVLNGKAGEALLDSYESERRPVAQRNVRWALISFMNHFVTDAGFGLIPGAPDEIQKAAFETLMAEGFEGDLYRARMIEVINTQRIEFQAHDIEIGFSYDSNAVVADGTPAPPRAAMGDIYIPTTRPGHRLPHAWIYRGDDRFSTHDVCGRGQFVLMVTPCGPAWQTAAQQVAEVCDVELKVVSIGKSGDYSDPEQRWSKLREVDADGAVLVRPDGHIGWRATTALDDPSQALTQALAALLGRGERVPARSTAS